MAKRQVVEGRVIKRLWAVGSKSEHEAVCLETDAAVMKLRRVGGNPFKDPELERLVGKRIEGQGEMLDKRTLLLLSWRQTE